MIAKIAASMPVAIFKAIEACQSPQCKPAIMAPWAWETKARVRGLKSSYPTFYSDADFEGSPWMCVAAMPVAAVTATEAW